MSDTACRWCGEAHAWAPKCPKVKAFVFHKDGVTVKRVEFYDPPPPYNTGLIQTYTPPATFFPPFVPTVTPAVAPNAAMETVTGVSGPATAWTTALPQN